MTKTSTQSLRPRALGQRLWSALFALTLLLGVTFMGAATMRAQSCTGLVTVQEVTVTDRTLNLCTQAVAGGTVRARVSADVSSVGPISLRLVGVTDETFSQPAAGQSAVTGETVIFPLPGTVAALPVGIYRLIASDASNPSQTCQVDLLEVFESEIQPIQFVEEWITPASCGLVGSNGSPLVSNGAGFVQLTGGVPPYYCLWQSQANGPSQFDTVAVGGDYTIATNLSAGLYTLTVEDSAGCVVSEEIVVPGPAPISVLENSAFSQCGFAQLTLSGGVVGAPKTVEWRTGSPDGPIAFQQTLSTDEDGNVVFNFIGDGTFYWRVYEADNDECFVAGEEPFVLTDPILVDADVLHIACFGFNSGAIDLTISGGSPGQDGYTIQWSNGATSEDLENIGAGTYTVTVSDATGCTVSQTYELLEPQNPLTLVDLEVVNVTCVAGQSGNEGEDGSIYVEVEGGILPYTFNLSNGQQTSPLFVGFAQFTELPADDYVLWVTDANDCIVITEEFSISEPAPLNVDEVVIHDVSCNGMGNGSATIYVSGGTEYPNGGYLYSWIRLGDPFFFGNEQTVTDLLPGTYFVTVTDANQCTFESELILISEPEFALQASIAVDNEVQCYLGNDGILHADILGGTAPYTFLWSGSANTNPLPDNNNATYEGLGAGNYSVVVIDANGCQTSAVATLTNPAQLNIGVLSTANTTVCNPEPIIDSEGNPILITGDGSVDITAFGGTGNFTFEWSPNPLGSTVVNIGPNQWRVRNLPAGSFTVTVTDENGCENTTDFVIYAPNGIQDLLFTNVGDATCHGGNDGEATVQVIQGGLPGQQYRYFWNGVEGGATRNFLSAGSYEVRVVQVATSCDFTKTLEIGQPELIRLNPTIVPEICAGGSDGSISLNITGGEAPYTYELNGSGTWIPLDNGQATLGGLSAGNYLITVRDAVGCEMPQVINLQEGPGNALFTYAAAVTPVTCAGNDNGMLALDASDFIGFVRYQISSDNGFSADFTVTGGDTSLTELDGGVYTVTASDNRPCDPTIQTVEVQESETALVVFPVAVVQNVTCFEGQDGRATVIASGGTEPYSFVWWMNGVAADTTALPHSDNLPAGDGVVQVTDAFGCVVSSDSFAITQPETGIMVDSTVVDVTNCSTYDGSIVLAIEGGTAPYTTVWNNGEYTGDSLSGLGADSYIYVVTDAIGCTASDTITLGSEFAFEIVAQANPFCPQDETGMIEVSVTGGSGELVYNWRNSQGATVSTTNILSDAGVGTYSLQVTDAKGCIGIHDFSVVADHATTVVTSTTISECATPTGTLTVSIPEGESSYTVEVYGQADFFATFELSSAPYEQTLTELAGGGYHIIVIDSLGCENEVWDTVGLNTTLQIALEATQAITCTGETDGELTVTVSGNTGDYAIEWTLLGTGTLPDTTETISGRGPGIYLVTVTDSEGCALSVRDTLVNPTLISASATSQNAVGQSSTGVITIVAQGGTPPYLYSLNDGEPQTSNVFNGLAPGIYAATIVDANGCIFNGLTNIVVNSSGCGTPLVITSAILPSGCDGQLNSGAIDLTVTGGDGFYTYTWSGPAGFTANTQDIQGLEPGEYTCIVSDGCGNVLPTGGLLVTVGNSGPTPTIDIIGTLEFCQGGSVLLNAPPGYLGYLWSNGDATQGSVIEESGTYFVTVLTACGSVSSATVTVTVRPLPSKPSVSQSTLPNNVVQLQSTTMGTSYQWYRVDQSSEILLAGQTNQTYQPRKNGEYIVEVYNQFGCSRKSDPIAVTTLDADDEITGSLAVYPNPTDGWLTLTLDRAVNGSVEIVNGLGQVALSTEIQAATGEAVRLDLSQLPAAIYQVRLTDGRQSWTAAVVKR